MIFKKSNPTPAKPKLRPYPPYKSIRHGAKVSWHTYADEKTAKAAAKIAEYNADTLERDGFDWGFQNPGYINKVADGYEVTVV